MRGGRDPRLVAGVDPRLFTGGRRPRVRRGDVQGVILTLLADQEMHGYQIITELAERSGGAWRPSPGSIYPTLARLEKQGLITARDEDGKRVFTLTPSGERAARSSDAEPWAGFAESPGAAELRTATANLVSALTQLDSVASDRQLTRAAEILKGARKSIYLMLAEEES